MLLMPLYIHGASVWTQSGRFSKSDTIIFISLCLFCSWPHSSIMLMRRCVTIEWTVLLITDATSSRDIFDSHCSTGQGWDGLGLWCRIGHRWSIINDQIGSGTHPHRQNGLENVGHLFFFLSGLRTKHWVAHHHEWRCYTWPAITHWGPVVRLKSHTDVEIGPFV